LANTFIGSEPAFDKLSCYW